MLGLAKSRWHAAAYARVREAAQPGVRDITPDAARRHSAQGVSVVAHRTQQLLGLTIRLGDRRGFKSNGDSPCGTWRSSTK
jgi:hypothetical protein